MAIVLDAPPMLQVYMVGRCLQPNPGHFKNDSWKTDKSLMDNWKIDVWKMMNLQHGLVRRERSASGRVQNSFQK